MRQDPLVDSPDRLHGTLVDVKVGKMGQEIVSDEDRDEDEIVDDLLERVFERALGGDGGELEIEVLS